ncbi:SPOR domain-containing protein [Parvularcula sp. IMCC14364]|uniref:SPOR domain-containing protein n=1 Tax=Parvularcula sp. IMCC14364 TaxID=3067902 RepID=UPI0027421E03|nr:SPOR domain-containing protein [Parvularcula sp. IMCC14364]
MHHALRRDKWLKAPAFGALGAMLVLPACESIGSGRLPAAPERSSPAQATGPVGGGATVQAPAKQSARSSTPTRQQEPEAQFYVTDSSTTIPEAPPKLTSSFDSNYDNYWQQTQSDYDPEPSASQSPSPSVYREPVPVSAQSQPVDSYTTAPSSYEASFPTAKTSATGQGRSSQVVSSQVRPTQPAAIPARAVPQPTRQASPVEQSSASVQSDPAGNAYALHLASYRGESNAAKGWQVLARQYDMYLSGLEPRLRLVDLSAKGTFYRLLAGPYYSRNEAASTCANLKALGAYCSVMPFTGVSL